MEINRLPVGVIPRIKGTTVSVEFIRENEDHLAAIFIGCYVVHVYWRVLVDETKVSDVRYLSGCIGVDTPTVMGVAGVIHSHRVSDTEGFHD